MTKLKLKVQLLKALKFKILQHQERLAVANHIVKKQSKLGEFNNSIKNISWKLKTLKRRKKLLDKELQVTQANYENLQKDFNEKRGIFNTKFRNVMDNMNLQRQVYHSGAKNENISNISTVFKPLLIKLSDDLEKEFPSREHVVIMTTLLTKFKQCYGIYYVLRPLCRHEVALLSIRCSGLGCWFPTQLFSCFNCTNISCINLPYS